MAERPALPDPLVPRERAFYEAQIRDELRRILRARGLSAAGRKNELVEPLVAADDRASPESWP